MQKQIIPIVFAANDFYAPYVATAVNSVVKNASDGIFCDIYIFNSDFKKKTVKKMNVKCDDYSITCVDLSEKLKKVDDIIYSASDYISKETCYRFFIPDVLTEYDKILYLDSDLCVISDIGELYNTDISDCLLGAIRNPLHKYMKNYIEKSLMIDPQKYINAGVLLMNAAKMREEKFSEKCFSLFAGNKNLRYADQDAINVICKDNIKYLSPEWNFEWHYDRLMTFKNSDYHLDKTEFEEYNATKKNIKIIHYTGDIKPWDNGGIKFANYFWEYAKTPFYKSIISRQRKVKIKKIPAFIKRKLSGLLRKIKNFFANKKCR